MAGDEDHTLTDQFSRGSDGLVRIAEVVGGQESHFLAEDAAGSIDVCHRQLCSALHLLAGPGICAGHGACYADQHFRLRAHDGGNAQDASVQK